MKQFPGTFTVQCWDTGALNQVRILLLGLYHLIPALPSHLDVLITNNKNGKYGRKSKLTEEGGAVK
eukprot:scaffold14842_cov517-Ochromonas_danica.AAC.1